MKKIAAKPQTPAIWVARYSGTGMNRLWNICDELGLLIGQTRNKEQAGMIRAGPFLLATSHQLLKKLKNLPAEDQRQWTAEAEALENATLMARNFGKGKK